MTEVCRSCRSRCPNLCGCEPEIPSRDPIPAPKPIFISGVAWCNKIEAIKIIRMISGLGLKEAKDLVESVELRPAPIPLSENLSEGARAQYLQNLSSTGLKLS